MHGVQVAGGLAMVLVLAAATAPLGTAGVDPTPQPEGFTAIGNVDGSLCPGGGTLTITVERAENDTWLGVLNPAGCPFMAAFCLYLNQCLAYVLNGTWEEGWSGPGIPWNHIWIGAYGDGTAIEAYGCQLCIFSGGQWWWGTFTDVEHILP